MSSANSRTTMQEHKDDVSSICSMHESREESSIGPQSAEDNSLHSRFSSVLSSSTTTTTTTTSDSKKEPPSSRRTTRFKFSPIPPTLLAQQFNNKGVKALNRGDYRKASLLFSQAIKTNNDDGVGDYCARNHCTISSCVRFSLQGDVQDSVADTSENFIYRRGISVHPEAMGRKMGNHALLQIATLNLAIARHLSCTERNFDNRREQGKQFQKVSSLYEMAFRWHIGESQGQDTVNVGFFLIIVNNLSQIHRISNNHAKLSLCREHMQSALMTILTNQESEWCQSLNIDGFFRTAFSGMTTCASTA